METATKYSPIKYELQQYLAQLDGLSDLNEDYKVKKDQAQAREESLQKFTPHHASLKRDLETCSHQEREVEQMMAAMKASLVDAETSLLAIRNRQHHIEFEKNEVWNEI
jgi:hypothetical protein